MLRMFQRHPSEALHPSAMDGRRHIIISGTGRAGTTLLVQILTHLGHDTGFSKEECLRDVDPASHAGLEYNLVGKRKKPLPYIVKAPGLSDQIDEAIAQGVQIDLAIIPVRDLESSVRSRIRVSALAAKLGKDPFKAAGGLWKTDNPQGQEIILLRQQFILLQSLIAHDIPILFLAFPRFAKDLDYFYRKMAPVVGHKNSYEEFIATCRAIIDLKKISQW